MEVTEGDEARGVTLTASEPSTEVPLGTGGTMVADAMDVDSRPPQTIREVLSSVTARGVASTAVQGGVTSAGSGREAISAFGVTISAEDTQALTGGLIDVESSKTVTKTRESAARASWGDDSDSGEEGINVVYDHRTDAESSVPVEKARPAVRQSSVPLAAHDVSRLASDVADQDVVMATEEVQDTREPARTRNRPWSERHRKRAELWVDINSNVDNYGEYGLVVDTGDLSVGGVPSAESHERTGGVASSTGQQGVPPLTFGRLIPLMEFPALDPFRDEQGRLYANCSFSGALNWIEQEGIYFPTGYEKSSGFNRELELKEEPKIDVKELRNRWVQWVPVLGGIDECDDPTAQLRIDFRNPQHRQLINFVSQRDLTPMCQRLNIRQVHDVSKPISGWLRHALSDQCRRRVPMNRFGWVTLVAIEAVFGVTSDEMLTIADNDRKGRFEILAIRKQRRQGQGVATYWFPWAVRAASGHSLTWLDYGTIMVPLTEVLCSQLPAMVHGTQHVHLSSILLYGLVPDREFNMFNMIPHFDPRAAQGQRFDS
jgi:RNA:NAD 2'-phosphotransferase (TPT1/KptA family)